MEIAFGKAGGLVPAIVQDDHTGDVLMLGFMNEDVKTGPIMNRTKIDPIA